MKITITSCALALAGIIIFILMAIFLDEKSFRDMGWIFIGMIAMAIITIAGLIFSTMAIFMERTMLSWICALVFLTPVFVIAINIGGEYYRNHIKPKEPEFQPLSHWKIEASTIIADKSNDRLIEVRGIRRTDGKDSADLPQVGKDDFSIHIFIYTRNSSENQSHILRIIPAGNGYKTKLFKGRAESRKTRHEDAALCAKVLNYYLALQSEIEKPPPPPLPPVETSRHQSSPPPHHLLKKSAAGGQFRARSAPLLNS